MTREEMEVADATLQAEVRQLILEAPSVSTASILFRFAVPMAWCGVAIAVVNFFQ